MIDLSRFNKLGFRADRPCVEAGALCCVRALHPLIPESPPLIYLSFEGKIRQDKSYTYPEDQFVLNVHHPDHGPVKLMLRFSQLMKRLNSYEFYPLWADIMEIGHTFGPEPLR